MKISADTLKILKSFASINPCIFLGDAQAIRVMAPDKGSVVGVYKTAESLDKDCVFWQWPELLSTIDIMGSENAELDFQEQFVKISSPDKSSLKYCYTSPIAVATQKKPKMYTDYCKDIEVDFTFELPAEALSKLFRLSKNMNLSQIQVEVKDNKGMITLIDPENKVNHTYEHEIDAKGNGSINLWINTMQFIPGSYDVSVKNNIFSKWVNKDIPLFYIVGAAKKGN